MSRIDDLIQELTPTGVQYSRVDEVAVLKRGTAITKKSVVDGPVPVIAGGRTPAYFHNESNRAGETVAIAGSGAYAGFVSYWSKPIYVSDAFTVVPKDDRVNARYLYFWLQSQQELLHSFKSGGGVPHVYPRSVSGMRIPVPHLEVQLEIVRVLDKFTQLEAELEAELEARRTQYEHYRAEFLTFKEEVPRRRLDEVAVYANGKAHEKLVVDGAEIPLVTARFISRNGEANRYVPLADVLTPGRTGDVALVLSDLPNGRALARTFFVDRDDSYAINQRVARITVKETAEMNPKFLHFLLDRNRGLLKHDNGVDQTHLSKGQVTGLTIPVPSIEEQNRIVDRLERFDGLVNDISIGLPAELAARRKQYEHYRDRLLTFKELTV
ncbi:restriction endonuclease subunit S [Brachybacterium alimentarium]|uniref:restriction endonuclease subunit S n=1 Tax=Brachybacterium alimentarium TaxID=47845 RepID=UPI000BB8C1BB|nr:restriction endonuclease subunit S [Brachybacterium alimentarium]PCC31985.1 hypothetical protein CIK71_13645 [Brachybacterium alimentarium]